MAIQDQGQGQLQEFLAIFKRRTGGALLAGAFAAVLGVSVAKLMPRKYTTKTGIELRETTLPIGGEGYDAKALQRDIASTTWQIKQVERVRRVVEKLEWPDFTALTPQAQHDYVRDMIEQLNVKLTAAKNNQGSSLIEIEYTDSDPQRAEQFLNRLRETYTTEVIERFRNDARAALDVLQNSREVARNALDERDREATAVKKLHNVSATQQAPGGGRMRDEDPVFVRLTDAERELAAVSSQLASGEAALAALQQQFEETPREVSKSLAVGGLSFDDEQKAIDLEIQSWREVQKGLRPAHSRYQEAELKIAKLEEKSEALREKASKPETEIDQVLNPRRNALSNQIQDQELELHRLRGLAGQLQRSIDALSDQQAERAEIYREIQRLDNETDIAAMNYKAASDAFNRQKRFVDLITQEYSNPFEVTELARTPNAPTSPNQPLIIAAAAVVGLGLGLASALLAEFGRGAFRGVADVSRSLSAPVLGVVNAIVTEREVMRARTRRWLVTTSTFALMGAILWVTWAFEHRPRWLGAELTQALEGVREMFR